MFKAGIIAPLAVRGVKWDGIFNLESLKQQENIYEIMTAICGNEG
jgi:hypothetical protein